MEAGPLRQHYLLVSRSVSGPTENALIEMCMITDDAIGLEGVFRNGIHPDDARPRSPFTSEANLDPDGTQRRLHAPQSAGERARIAGPAGAVCRTAVTVATGAGPQKVGGAACPRTALGHEPRTKNPTMEKMRHPA
jgi:hypothetical protein